MRIWTAETEDELPVATAERITVILSVPGPAALALIGLSGIAEDGDGEASGA